MVSPLYCTPKLEATFLAYLETHTKHLVIQYLEHPRVSCKYSGQVKDTVWRNQHQSKHWESYFLKQHTNVIQNSYISVCSMENLSCFRRKWEREIQERMGYLEINQFGILAVFKLVNYVSSTNMWESNGKILLKLILHKHLSVGKHSFLHVDWKSEAIGLKVMKGANLNVYLKALEEMMKLLIKENNKF